MTEILSGLFAESNPAFSIRPTATAVFHSVLTCQEMKLEAAAAVLGVAVDADPETLKAAYRRLALRWHPDKCKDPDAKERFQEVWILHTMESIMVDGWSIEEIYCVKYS